MSKKKQIIRKSIEAADGLSLGISIVVAVLIGIGIGIFLKKTTGIPWFFWIGVFIGIGAAILNVFKAYKSQVKSYEEFTKENRYKDLKK